MQRQYSDRPGKLFETGSGFYYYTGKIFDLLVLSVLWLLGSIPVITAGTALCGLYAAAERNIVQDNGKVSEQFWNSYKKNLKSGIFLGMLFAASLFLLLLNLGIVWNKMDGLVRLFFVLLYLFCLVFCIMVGQYAFPAMSRFDMPVGWIIKLAVYLTVKHLPLSVLLAVLTGIGYVLALSMPVLLLVLPGVIAYLSALFVAPILDQHMPETTVQ